MSANLDLVRSIYADWERGDYYSSTAWAHPDIEFVVMDGPSPGRLTGVAAVEDNWRDFQETWEDYHLEAVEYRQLDDQRILVITQLSGRGKASGLEVAQTGGRAANVFHLHEDKVHKLVIYWDGDRALADLGLRDG